MGKKLPFLLLWLGLIILAKATMAQDSQFARELLPVWQRSMAYTLEVAEAMPDSLYDYRPTTEVFTFAEHLAHLERNLYSLSSRFIQAPTVPAVPTESLSKAECIALLRHRGEQVSDLLKTLTDEEWQTVVPDFWGPDPITRAGIIWLMRDHMTHHRGQLIVYLRLHGVEPPRYRGW